MGPVERVTRRAVLTGAAAAAALAALPAPARGHLRRIKPRHVWALGDRGKYVRDAVWNIHPDSVEVIR